MKRYSGFIMILVVAMLAFSTSLDVSAQRKRTRTRTPAIPTITQVTAALDSLNAPVIESYLAQDTVASPTESAVRRYIASLPAKFDKKALYDYYEDRMVTLTEAGQPDSLITVCVIATQLSNPVLTLTACEGIVQAMGARADAKGLEHALGRLALVADPAVVDELRLSFDDILNPIDFAETVKGYWVSTSKTDGDNYPYLILRIVDINKDGGISLINLPGRTQCDNDNDLYNLRWSQRIGGEHGHLMASFASKNLKVGDSSFAESGFQTTRKFRAESAATISTSKASFGDKMAATAVTGLVAGLMDGLFSASAQSSTHVAALNLDMIMESPIAMTGNTEYYNYWATPDRMSYIPSPVKRSSLYCKWEPEDKVFFVDSKNKVFSVSYTSDLDLTEYNSIMKEYSWKRPKYWVPTTLSIAGGAGLITTGLIMALDCKTNEIDKNGHNKLNNTKLVGGIAMCVVGYLGAMIVPIQTHTNRTMHRAAALSKLNEANRAKLEVKARASLLSGTSGKDTGIGLTTSVTF